MTEGIVITRIDEVIGSGSGHSDIMRKLMTVLPHGYDGRPDGWKSLGYDRAGYHRGLLAELDSLPVGLAMGHLQPGEVVVPPDQPNPYYDGIQQLEAATGGSWFLSLFAVHPARRRLGAGSRLLAAAEEAAIQCGGKTISLIVPLPDAPDPGPNPPVKGYDVREERRADTIPFLERRGYVKRLALSGFHSLGIPVTNQLMTKELADG